MIYLIKALCLILSILIVPDLSAQDAAASQLIVKNVHIVNFDQSDAHIRIGNILIHGDTIEKIDLTDHPIAEDKNFQIVDGTGMYAMPGLIDGFATLNNQAYANAYLYKGVTSIIGVSGGRRGNFFSKGNPSPGIFRLKEIGDEPIEDSEIQEILQNYADENIRVCLLMYQLKPGQTALVIQLAKKYGMATIGELGVTSYEQGLDLGIQAFVHSTRYSLPLAPDSLTTAVIQEPFSDLLDSPKWRYYLYLSGLNPTAEKITSYAEQMAESSTFIMPTLSLFYLDLPGHRNPWLDPVAKMIKPEDINNPASPESGNHLHTLDMAKAYTAVGTGILSIEQTYRKYGAKYLAGSATDVWGTMPGISLHTELELLQRTGLSNREVLAAATVNFHKAFGWKVGKIADGFKADLLLLKEDPLKNISALDQIHSIILNGKMLNKDSLLR